MGADQNLDWHGLAASALEWWQEAGVGPLVDEAPRDWLAPLPPAPPARDVAAGTIVVPSNAPAIASPHAPLPDTLEAFVAWRMGPDAPEARWPGRPLAPSGVAGADLMILLDQPEREDGDSGQLLSGPAGRLFDGMLAAIGRTRADVYLASVATVRPASGRVLPEIASDLAAVARRHVALVRPRRLLALGDAASRALLSMGVVETRGGLRAINLQEGQGGDDERGTRETQGLATFHPRFLLDRPACKADAWRDLQMVIGGLDA